MHNIEKMVQHTFKILQSLQHNIFKSMFNHFFNFMYFIYLFIYLFILYLKLTITKTNPIVCTINNSYAAKDMLIYALCQMPNNKFLLTKKNN